jgi:hypothetical protein
MARTQLSAVIAEYVRGDAGDGDRRELRSALSHIDAELGTMPIRHIGPRTIRAMLDDLADAGLSPRREAAVIDALHGVFAYAAARGLIDHDPTPPRVTRPGEAPRSRPRPVTTATPTLTMLALGARVAFWTTWIIVVGFLVLLIALLFEFG